MLHLYYPLFGSVGKEAGKHLFFINFQRRKVNAQVYVQHLRQLLSQCQDLCSREDMIFVQDSAKITQEFLSANYPESVRPTERLPSSPDLNPLDYHIWNRFSPFGYCNKELKCVASRITR